MTFKEIKLTTAQQTIYDAIKKDSYEFDFSTIESLKKTYPSEFSTLTIAEFEEFKNNPVAVIKKLYPILKDLDKEDVLRWMPRGTIAIVGQSEYLKFARLLGINDIYFDTNSVNSTEGLAEIVGKTKLLEITAAFEEVTDPNFISDAIGLLGTIKNEFLKKMNSILGIKEKTFSSVVDKRNAIFDQPKLTEQKTTPEEALKIPHKISAFGEPRNTAEPQYPYNHITHTNGGHIVELDDTPEAPRVRLQHANGAGIQVNADGHFIRKTTYDNYDIHDEDTYKSVKGYTTQVHNKQVFKKYSDGVLYQTTNTRTEASQRAHFQTPILSYNEMLLGKKAIFSDNVIVKKKLTTNDCNVENQLSAPKATIKVLKGSYANILAREATLAWDIGSSGEEDMDLDAPTGGAIGDQTRPMINKSLQFKEGAQNNPSFIKPVIMDHPVSFSQSAIPTTGTPNSLTVVDGVVYTSNSAGVFSPLMISNNVGNGH